MHQSYGDVYGAWRAMEELHQAGKIRAIGIRKRSYKTRVLARADIFDYIDIFYNRARRPVISTVSESGGLRTD